MSLQTRFIVSVVALILVLVVVILVIIEQRERRALFEEQKSKGILIAKYIAQMNNYALQQWDEYGVQESVDNQIDENLIYVIFYDRGQNPWVSNKSIKAYKDILANSFLSENTGRNDFFFARRKIETPATDEILRILEIEIPIFAEGSSQKSWSIKIGYSLEEMRLENQKTRLMLILFGLGGLIIVDRNGGCARAYSTPGMRTARAQAGSICVETA